MECHRHTSSLDTDDALSIIRGRLETFPDDPSWLALLEKYLKRQAAELDAISAYRAAVEAAIKRE